MSANYTHGLVAIGVNPAALTGIPRLDKLDDRAIFDANTKLVTHDAESPSSKWAPVIKITKHNRGGPVPTLNVTYYKAIVIFVLLETDSRILTLQDFFDKLHLTSFADF